MNTVNPQTWMQENWPNCKALDHDWTMERYDYPQEVRDWIKENWIKVNDENGGTFHEPEYYKLKQSNDTPPQNLVDKFQKFIDTPIENENDGKSFAKSYKETGLDKGMDDANKKALDVMATEGMDSAIKYMFTDQETGRQLSYGEMRSRYG
tara:strand:- start:173 stop:625 length:453 start_codon:yes stop_codon:yes gene_type:complete